MGTTWRNWPSTLPGLLFAGALVHVAVALSAIVAPEWGDLAVFRLWAVRAAQQGILSAYSWEGFAYDWLPLNLVVFWAVGTVYEALGLLDWLGPHSPVLGLLLKLPMIGFHLLGTVVLWHLSRSLDDQPERSRVVVAAWLLNPAIALAMGVFGYQDAFHTLLLLVAAAELCRGRSHLAAPWLALAALSKPQAWIFLVPFLAFAFLRSGFRGLSRIVALGGVTAGVVLLPFLAGGELASVGRAYLNAPRVHPWLSAAAHNTWWLLFPASSENAFPSDREALVLGLNGLTIGLLALAGYCGLALFRLAQRRTPHALIHLSAFLAFAFFMVSTEIHENHIYAVFPFLTLAAVGSRFLSIVLVALSFTFFANLLLTLSWLDTGVVTAVGGVRIGVVNSLLNVLVLLVWTVWVLRGRDPE